MLTIATTQDSAELTVNGTSYNKRLLRDITFDTKGIRFFIAGVFISAQSGEDVTINGETLTHENYETLRTLFFLADSGGGGGTTALTPVQEALLNIVMASPFPIDNGNYTFRLMFNGDYSNLFKLAVENPSSGASLIEGVYDSGMTSFFDPSVILEDNAPVSLFDYNSPDKVYKIWIYQKNSTPSSSISANANNSLVLGSDSKLFVNKPVTVIQSSDPSSPNYVDTASNPINLLDYLEGNEVGYKKFVFCGCYFSDSRYGLPQSIYQPISSSNGSSVMNTNINIPSFDEMTTFEVEVFTTNDVSTGTGLISNSFVKSYSFPLSNAAELSYSKGTWKLLSVSVPIVNQ